MDDEVFSYQDYLNSNWWRETRKKRLEIDNHQCCLCGSERYLHVHHLTYERLGKEDVDNDLMTLCEDCHHLVHELMPTLRQPLYEVRHKANRRLSNLPELQKINDSYISDMREVLKENLSPLYDRLKKQNRKNMARLLTRSLNNYEYPSLLLPGFDLKGNRYNNVIVSIKEYYKEY